MRLEERVIRANNISVALFGLIEMQGKCYV